MRILAAALCLVTTLAFGGQPPFALWHPKASTWEPPEPDSVTAWLGYNADQAVHTDLSGNGNSATNEGTAPVWQSGGFYMWSANNSRHGVPTNVVNALPAITFCGWIRRTSYIKPAYLWYAVDASYGVALYFSATNQLRFIYTNDDNFIGDVYSTLNVCPTGVWTHVACSWSPDVAGPYGRQGRIYINGVLDNAGGSVLDGGGLHAIGGYVAVGGRRDQPTWKIGADMDGFIWWSKELLDTQIGDVYVGETGPNAPHGLEGDGS